MKIAELLTDESKRCRFAAAQDKDGHDVDADSPEAVKWCLVGAFLKCYPNPVERFEAQVKMNATLSKSSSRAGLVWWNDRPTTTIEDIHKMAEEAGV